MFRQSIILLPLAALSVENRAVLRNVIKSFRG